MKKNIIIFTISIFVSISVFAFAQANAAAPGFTGKNWAALSNAQKVSEVKAFIKDLKTKGITVKGAPAEYCRKLDSFYAANPNLKNEEAGKTLKTLMIMEYDWEAKGGDKDAIAKEWLGDELYKKNKARLGR